jgi:hypothetical protein
MIWPQRSTHSLQIKTPGPATKRLTLLLGFKQNEQDALTSSSVTAMESPLCCQEIPY